MTEDGTHSPEDRQAYVARFGEYRRVPIARYGQFRIDRVWFRSNTTKEREFSLLYDVVFEIDGSSEFDMMGSGLEMFRMLGSTRAAGPVPSRSEMLRLATIWLGKWRPTPGGGMVGLACYRRRVGPPAGGQEATPGEWYIDPLFRRAGKPLIDMDEAIPLVEAALHELEQAETATGTEGHSREL